MGIQKKENKQPKKQSNQPEFYSVEQILDSKENAAGEKLYFVKWEGYDEITWEPYENLKTVKYLVDAFEKAKERKHHTKEIKDKDKNKSELLREKDKKKQIEKNDIKYPTNEKSTLSPVKKIKKITKETINKKQTKEHLSKNSKNLIVVEAPNTDNTKTEQNIQSDPTSSLPPNNLPLSSILEKTPKTDALIKYSTKNSEIKERCDSEKLQQLFNAKSIVSSQQQGSLQHNVVDKIINHCRGVENEWLYLVSWMQLPHSPSVLTPSYISSQALQLKYHDKIINYLESIQLS